MKCVRPLFWAYLLRASHLPRHFVARSQFYLKLDDFGWRGSRADQHQNAIWANPYHLIHSGSGKYRLHVADGISVRRDDHTQQLGETR